MKEFLQINVSNFFLSFFCIHLLMFISRMYNLLTKLIAFGFVVVVVMGQLIKIKILNDQTENGE